MTRKIILHEKLCKQLHETYIAKNHDYGDSFGKSVEQFGLVAAAVRLSDKFNRLCALLNAESMVNESLEDTLLDMANYCIMTVVEIRRKGQKDDQ